MAWKTRRMFFHGVENRLALPRRFVLPRAPVRRYGPRMAPSRPTQRLPFSGLWRAALFAAAAAPLALAPPAPAAEGVVLLHGLCRSSASMETMKTALEKDGFVVLNVDYPSRTATVDALADLAVGGALASPSLANCTSVHFVAHSLGGILVRSYFSRNADPRLGRVVMLGPPNRGSEVVDHLKEWKAFQKLNGPAGSQLGTDPKSKPNALGPVPFELGVVAGSRSVNWINSLMIPGPDDGKVSVESTKIPGMKDHLVVRCSHPFIMKDRRAVAATRNFLAAGKFAPPAPAPK